MDPTAADVDTYRAMIGDPPAERETGTVTRAGVRRLPASGDNAELVLVGGRARVVTGTDDHDEFTGALQVISRHELLDRLGGVDGSDGARPDRGDTDHVGGPPRRL